MAGCDFGDQARPGNLSLILPGGDSPVRIAAAGAAEGCAAALRPLPPPALAA